MSNPANDLAAKAAANAVLLRYPRHNPEDAEFIKSVDRKFRRAHFVIFDMFGRLWLTFLAAWLGFLAITDWHDDKHVPEANTVAYWRSVAEPWPWERFYDWRAHVAHEADKALCDRLPGKVQNGPFGSYAETYSAQYNCHAALRTSRRAARYSDREQVAAQLKAEAKRKK